jgi:hypothetical protein
MQFFLQLPVTSVPCGPNILLRNLSSKTLSLYSSLNVRDQVLAIQNHRQNYGLVYSNFYILDSRRDDKKFWTEW